MFIGLQFVEGGREAIESDPFISQLNAVKEGRVLYVPADVEDALQFSTVLSLPYALDGIATELEAIFPGEAAPEATEAVAAAGECPEGMWLFDHERLATDPVCIPENPQRIISLDMPATEFVLLNDIPLVGVFGYAGDEISAVTPGLASKLEGIPTFDWPPNLELATFTMNRRGEKGLKAWACSTWARARRDCGSICAQNSTPKRKSGWSGRRLNS